MNAEICACFKSCYYSANQPKSYFWDKLEEPDLAYTAMNAGRATCTDGREYSTPVDI